MIGRIMSSVIGARVVFGLAVAGILASGFLFWRWTEARGDAADARAAADSAREVAEHNADRVAEIQAERERLDRILTKQRRTDRERRQQLQQRVSELRDAIAQTDCGPTAMPDPVRERVFDPDQDGDRGRSGEGEGSGSAD